MVKSLISGWICEVTGYSNPPTGKYLGVGCVDSVKFMFLDFFDMYVGAFDIFDKYLDIILLIH
jgi:hypothetical protein